MPQMAYQGVASIRCFSSGMMITEAAEDSHEPESRREMTEMSNSFKKQP